MVDAVEITDIEGKSIVLSDFLSKWVIQSSFFHVPSDSLGRDKMMQKLLTYKIESDRLAEQGLSSAVTSHTMAKCRQRNTSQYVILVCYTFAYVLTLFWLVSLWNPHLLTYTCKALPFPMQMKKWAFRVWAQ
jgi:hypothetical protein